MLKIVLTYTYKIMKIGYARVSTQDQNFELQEDSLKKSGCEMIFTETASGAKTDRPECKFWTNWPPDSGLNWP